MEQIKEETVKQKRQYKVTMTDEQVRQIVFEECRKANNQLYKGLMIKIFEQFEQLKHKLFTEANANKNGDKVEAKNDN